MFFDGAAFTVSYVCICVHIFSRYIYCLRVCSLYIYVYMCTHVNAEFCVPTYPHLLLPVFIISSLFFVQNMFVKVLTPPPPPPITCWLTECLDCRVQDFTDKMVRPSLVPSAAVMVSLLLLTYTGESVLRCSPSL